ncbi:MAG: SDR family oxidoreductase [Anaerolineales bacterium]|nr:SDR family oxidoreductase [Anaerolineales bacterium]
MKILFIGGTGIISSACSELALARGYDLTLLNRAQSHRPIPDGARQIQADIRNLAAAKEALADEHFDVVVNWVAFTPEHIATDLELFNGRTGQYVFISSASAYQTPPTHLPITESTPLHNPFWAYSRQKIACENRLMRAYRETGFPVTIIRPSHTYDQTLLPMRGRYTVVNRMRQGKKVVVHGDGTSLWTLTHHRDFAVAFVGLLGHPAAIGDVFHITSDESLSWNQIFQQVAAAAGAEAQIVHVPSDILARYDADWGDGLLGDKAHSMIFDNSKIKRLVPEFVAKIPFWQGAKEIIAWYDADPTRQTSDPAFDQLLDNLVARYDPEQM